MKVLGALMMLLGSLSQAMADGQGTPTAPLKPPTLTLVFTLRVQVGPPTELGELPAGRRRIIPIVGGTFAGPAVRGKVLPGGADCRSSSPTAWRSWTPATPCRPTAAH